MLMALISIPAGYANLHGQILQSPDYIPIRKDARLYFLSSEGGFITSINVEISEKPADLTRGLMGPRVLELSEGMLFIFHNSEPRQFWMRNTRMSLDIIFIDEEKKVINVCDRTMPMSDTVYTSEKPARYVVEVLAGFTKIYNITEGCQVAWEGL